MNDPQNKQQHTIPAAIQQKQSQQQQSNHLQHPNYNNKAQIPMNFQSLQNISADNLTSTQHIQQHIGNNFKGQQQLQRKQNDVDQKGEESGKGNGGDQKGNTGNHVIDSRNSIKEKNQKEEDKQNNEDHENRLIVKQFIEEEHRVQPQHKQQKQNNQNGQTKEYVQNQIKLQQASPHNSNPNLTIQPSSIKLQNNQPSQHPSQNIYNIPIEIQLPQKKQQQLTLIQVDVIVPCTFHKPITHIPPIHHQNPPTKDNKQDINNFKANNLKSEQSMIQSLMNGRPDVIQQQKDKQQSIIYSQIGFHRNPTPNNQLSRTKVMTSVLLDKISELQQKIKNLETQKQKLKIKHIQHQHLQQHPNKYQSTPTKRVQFGSIIKNQQNQKKQFHSISHETQQTSNNNMNFRVRNFGSISRSASNNKIHSNVYNQTLIENSRQSSLVREQIRTLKEKIKLLENNYHLDRTIKQSLNQSHNKILKQNSYLESGRGRQHIQLQLHEGHDGKQRMSLKGKIVKRNISHISQFSPSNNCSVDSGYKISPGVSQGFVRNSVPVSEFRQHTEENQINESQVYGNKEHSAQRKRIDSSAIFRKKSDNKPTNSFPEFKTLQFNPQKQKYVIDSKETQQLFYPSSSITNNASNKYPISPITKKNKESCQKIRKQEDQLLFYEDIDIPDFQLIPQAGNTSDQLIEIGKLTFIKLGCQINQTTQLNVKKYKNCVYFGISNSPENNILWHYDHKFYFGGWKSYTNGEGQKSGAGIENMPNKYKFKGYFVEGKRHGHGTLILYNQQNHKNQSVYAGQFQQGYKHGHGKQIDNSGETIYIGEFKNNKKNGFGRIYYNFQLQFEGVFSKGLKNGYGKENFENGDEYDGNYINNKFQGKGMYKWKSGAIYTGEFVNGRRQGQGIWKTNQDGTGDYYEGDYFQDLKHGYGVYRWANGCVYEGGFQNDLKHGQGKMTYQNGKVAHLVWHNGKVQKKNQMLSNRPTTNKSAQKRPGSNIAFKTSHHSSTKKFPISRSTQKIQSAKSTSSLPKGISFRKDQLQRIQNKNMNNKNSELLKTKLGDDGGNKFKIFSRSGQSSKKLGRGPPKDPPYKGMQITANINMNM